MPYRYWNKGSWTDVYLSLLNPKKVSEAASGFAFSSCVTNEEKENESERGKEKNEKEREREKIDLKNGNKMEMKNINKINSHTNTTYDYKEKIEDEHSFISTSSAEEHSFPSFRILTKPIDLLRITKILHTHFEECSSGLPEDKEHSLGITLHIPLTRKAQVC